MALQSLSIYYSWPNITAAYGNNTFQYSWLGTPVSVTLPDGFYTISEVNSYLQSVMVANSQYLIDSAGNYVYFLEITTNSSLYAVQLNAYPIPTSTQAAALGYTLPTGWAGYPVSATTPQFIVPSTDLQNIFGISAGTYPAATQSTVYSKTSSFTPQFSPVSSVYVLCSLVNSRYSLPQNVIYNFSPSVTYGSKVVIQPPYLVYSKIQEGSYPSVTVQFVDQSFQALNILDSNISVLLSIKEP